MKSTAGLGTHPRRFKNHLMDNFWLRIILGNRVQQLLFYLCFLSLPVCLTAQNSIGIQIGKSYSKFDVMRSGNFKIYDFSEEFDHDGFLAEMYYSYALGRFIKLRPSISYNKRGALIERSYGIVNHDKLSLNYLGVTLTAGVSPIKYLTLNGGLGYCYLLKSSLYRGNGRVSNNTDLYNRFDLGYRVGFTVNIKNIFVNASYFEGINPVWELDHALFNSNAIEYRNRSIEVSIGYNFTLSKKKKQEMD